jgi:hypothetical protein
LRVTFAGFLPLVRTGSEVAKMRMILGMAFWSMAHRTDRAATRADRKRARRRQARIDRLLAFAR